MLKAQVTDEEGFQAFENLLIVNIRTRQGIYGNTDGSFEIKMLPSDTLIIGSLGFKTRKFYLESWDGSSVIKAKIPTTKLSVDLSMVHIFPQRELKEIHNELERLQFDRTEYLLSGIDAFQSPITFLYQSFSRREKQKVRAYEIIMEDRKREVLKELLQKYIDANIIALSPKEFDDFIDFCQVPDAVIKTSTQYEFIMYVKGCYNAYVKYGR